MKKKKDIYVGAMWLKDSEDGKFVTGDIEIKPEIWKDVKEGETIKIGFVASRNRDKEGQQPDFFMKVGKKGIKMVESYVKKSESKKDSLFN